MSGKTLFAQTMAYLPWTTFGRIVALYKGDHRVARCSEQYRVMAFAQMTYRESLRDMFALAAARRRSCPQLRMFVFRSRKGA